MRPSPSAPPHKALPCPVSPPSPVGCSALARTSTPSFAPENDVERPGDDVAAMQNRGAAAQDLDALHLRYRRGIEIDGGVGNAAAVDEICEPGRPGATADKGRGCCNAAGLSAGPRHCSFRIARYPCGRLRPRGVPGLRTLRGCDWKWRTVPPLHLLVSGPPTALRRSLWRQRASTVQENDVAEPAHIEIERAAWRAPIFHLGFPI